MKNDIRRKNILTKVLQKSISFLQNFLIILQKKDVNEIAAFVGGIQGCIAGYKLYQYEISKKIEIEIERISFLDTFGAGWEDGGAGGMVKQWIPGLVAMFCLQHFKNTTDKTKYQPFTVIIDIEL